jgi:hypothetical protein
MKIIFCYDIPHKQKWLTRLLLRKKNEMKNWIKQKHVGFALAVIGIALLSLTFLSYLMSSAFVSKTALPLGIVLLIVGIVVIKRARKKSKNQAT